MKIDRHSIEKIRIRLYKIFDRIKSEAAENFLFEELDRDQNEESLSCLISALLSIKSGLFSHIFTRYLEHQSPAIRMLAFRGVGIYALVEHETLLAEYIKIELVPGFLTEIIHASIQYDIKIFGPQYERLLEHKSNNVKIAAIEACAETGYTKVERTLYMLLKSTQDERVRIAIVKYFSRLGRVGRLFDTLYNDNPTVRLVTLGEISHHELENHITLAEYSRHICKLLEDENEMVRLGAIRSIHSGTEKILTTLLHVWTELHAFYYNTVSETIYNICKENESITEILNKKIETALFSRMMQSVKATQKEDSLIWLSRYLKMAARGKDDSTEREKLASYFKYEGSRKGADGSVISLFIKHFNEELFLKFAKELDSVSRITDIRDVDPDENRIIGQMIEILARLGHEKSHLYTVYFSETADPEILLSIIRCYAYLKVENLNEMYTQYLDSPDEKIVGEVLDIIAQRHLKGFSSLIQEKIQYCKNSKMLHKYAVTLSIVSDFSKIDVFYRLLHEKNENMVILALEHILKYRDKSVLDSVREILGTTASNRIKAYCLKYMWYIGISDALDVLAEMTLNSAADARRAALEVIDSFPNNQKAKYMVYLLADSNSIIANKAQATLEKMKGADSVQLITSIFSDLERNARD